MGPSTGATLAFLVDAYEEEADRTVLRFDPRLAPIKAAILPLISKEGMPEMAEKIYHTLRKQWNVFYDDKGNPFPSNNKKQMISKLEIVRDGTKFNIPLRLAD